MHVEWDKAARILNFAKSVSTALDLRDHIEDLGVVEEGGGGGTKSSSTCCFYHQDKMANLQRSHAPSEIRKH